MKNTVRQRSLREGIGAKDLRLRIGRSPILVPECARRIDAPARHMFHARMATRSFMDIRPVTLEGRHVALEPLDLERHWDGLRAIGLAPELWRFTSAKIANAEDLRRYLDIAVDEERRGVSLPFATIHRESGRVAGCTRFGNITREHRRVEIGWTWVGLEHQRTMVNTEAKLLMLRHAFETWGCMRVEFKTARTNLKSQNAMRRLGLIEEGTFRKWMFNDDGTIRDSVWFSCIDDEWPEMKARLEGFLAR